MSRERELIGELRDLHAGLAGRRVGLTRGNHGHAQRKISLPMYEWGKRGPELYAPKSKVFCANYGPPECLLGIPESREFFAAYLEVDDPANVAVLGNSSLSIMDNICTWSLTASAYGLPWHRQKFLCEDRGYDRHFNVHERNATGMIPVPMERDGPDIEFVRQQLEEDHTIVGMICVPQYENPLGISYSEVKVKAMAEMRPLNPSFQWVLDNAYPEHHLVKNPAPRVPIWNIFKEARALDRLWLVGSLSKVTFPGEAIAAVASSERNLAWLTAMLIKHTIGYPKLPQLWHYLFLPDMVSVRAHMEKQRLTLAPKFNLVYESMRELGIQGACSVAEPDGGYFTYLTLPQGTAEEVVKACAEFGLDLTGAGAPYPYKKNPENNLLRVAPSCIEPEDEPFIRGILPRGTELGLIRALG